MSKSCCKKWLAQDFVLRCFPPNFFSNVEELIKELIKEVECKHPLWAEKSSLRVNEIRINLDETPMSYYADSEYDPESGLIAFTIGPMHIIKNEVYDPSMASQKMKITTEMIAVDNLKSILFHEFGHPLDRTNPNFHYVNLTNLSNTQELLLVCLWNAYIDGRISRANLPICIDLKNRTAEACRYGGSKANTESIKKAIDKVWESEEITYEELIEIARKEIPSDPESKKGGELD